MTSADHEGALPATMGSATVSSATMGSAALSSGNLRSAAALVFVSDLDNPELGADDAHHLATVLRLSPRETVVAADGIGGWRACVLRPARDDPDRSVAGRAPPRTGAGGDERWHRRGRGGPREPAHFVLEAVGPVTVADRPVPLVTVGFAVTKGDRTEWTVQKLTELGVDQIWPLMTDRTVVRLDALEAGRRAERLRRVAREAAAQSRQPFLPEVREPTALRDAIASLALQRSPSPVARALEGVALAEPGGGPLRASTTTVLVGPEGGWSLDELSQGPEHIALGASVLRSETAAIVAGTLLTAIRGGVVRSL